MSQFVTGVEIERLIQLLAKLPGLGPRSARRAALHLIKKKEQLLVPLQLAIEDTLAKVGICSACGNIDSIDPCTVCSDPRRDQTIICVVEEIADLWALERAAVYKGQYHVLGGVLSAIDGIGPEDLNLPKLIARVREENIAEVLLAMNATVDGQTTAHYITDQLDVFTVKVSRLAHGVPVGGELDYLDEGTLAAAINARRPF